MFDGEDIHDLTFVRSAQELGFSLTEVTELQALRQKHHVCSEVQSMLKRKLGDVREKINSLSRLEAELAKAFRNCNRELRLKREVIMTETSHSGNSRGFRTFAKRDTITVSFRKAA